MNIYRFLLSLVLLGSLHACSLNAGMIKQASQRAKSIVPLGRIGLAQILHRKNHTYDVSKIHTDYAPIVSIEETPTGAVHHWKEYTFPCIMKYQTPTNKSLYFFADIHGNQNSINLMEKLCTNKKFECGIIENAILSSAIGTLIHPYSFNTHVISEALKQENSRISSMDNAIRHLTAQNALIIPGEHENSLEQKKAFHDDGLKNIDLAAFELLINTQTKSEKTKPSSSSTDSISEIFEEMRESLKSMDSGMRKLVIQIIFNTPLSLIEEHIAAQQCKTAYTIEILKKTTLTRDKKLLQTLLSTALHTQLKGNILVTYGAAHWVHLRDALSQHLGQPEYFSMDNYNGQ